MKGRIEEAAESCGNCRDVRSEAVLCELNNPPFHEFLQPILEEILPDGTVIVRLDYRPEFSGRRNADFFHGGIVAALIDIAAHAVVAAQVGKMVPTIDLHVDYLRPAVADSLYARASIMKAGKRIGRASVDVTDNLNCLIASGRGAFSTH